MDVEKRWREAVGRVASACAGLDAEARRQLELSCRRMMEQKRSLQRIVAGVDAAQHCAGCGGACCVTGRYHFTPVDLLAFLVAPQPLFVPRFDNGLCPYLGEAGCLMAPQFRPFNCITFNCEVIEERLAEAELARFYALERELRQSYAAIRAGFAGSLDGALL